MGDIPDNLDEIKVKTYATPEELAERYEAIKRFMIRGWPNRKIIRWIVDESGWNITARMGRYYIQRTLERLSDEAPQTDRRSQFVIALERLNHIYERAMGNSELGIARQAVNDGIKLLRLDTPDKQFNWRKAAADAGIDPSEAFAMMVELASKDSDDASG